MHADLNPLSLFWMAGPVVKAVMLMLLAASLWCWIIVAECLFATRRLRQAVGAAEAGRSSRIIEAIFDGGAREAALHYPDEAVGARRERVVGAMRRRVQETIEAAHGGLANLAVIASVGPFLGLFGTVWGIMTSFIGIAGSQDTSLATVAPGIAEALAATAIGLAAAIPAAFGYNQLVGVYGRLGKRLVRLVEDDAARVLRPQPDMSHVTEGAR
ncbi:MotA/TolQ/ExbB proton channel family protein [Phreatobacter stygius]